LPTETQRVSFTCGSAAYGQTSTSNNTAGASSFTWVEASDIKYSSAGLLLVEDTQELQQPSKLWLASPLCRAAI